MLELTVPDMTCAHCVNVITRAVGEIDRAAKLEFDLPARRVSTTSGADAATIRRAIEQAGYTVSGIRQENVEPQSCCGTCRI